jgi:hypothetical protein
MTSQCFGITASNGRSCSTSISHCLPEAPSIGSVIKQNDLYCASQYYDIQPH